MKTLMKSSLIGFFLLFISSAMFAQKNRNAKYEYDVYHPAPQIVCVSIAETKAIVQFASNTNTKYDMITCKNILTGENIEMQQASAENVYLNNLKPDSLYEVSIHYIYADGEASEALQFCFSTELTTVEIPMKAQRYDVSEK